MKRKILNILSILTLLVSSLTGLANVKVSAQEITGYGITANLVHVQKDGTVITLGNTNKQLDSGLLKYNAAFDFTNVRDIDEGDTLTLQLPAELKLAGAISFPVTNAAGSVVGHAVGNSNTNNSVIVTFTDFFSKVNEQRTMELTFDVRATDDSAQTIETTIPGTATPVSYNTGVSVIPGVSYKYSYRSSDDPQKIHWVAIVNASQEPVRHLVIEDTLSEGQYFTDEDKANIRVLRKVVVAEDPIDSEREISERLTVDNHRRDVVFSETGFTYTAPDEYIQTLDGKDYGHPYYILYTTHIKDEAYATGNVLNNTITVKGSNGYNNPYTARYVVDSGTGRASAVKSDKVILETQKLVEGAGASLKADQFEFALYAADDLANPLQVKKNDADGKVTFDALILKSEGQFNYVIKEVIPAEADRVEGYTYDEGQVDVLVDVTKDADNVYRGSAAYGEKTTFTNTYQALTDVSGTKTWKGDDAAKRPESVTVQLLADGVALAGQTTDTDAEGNYSFENLPKYNADGSEINYTVEELYVPFGYEVSYDETHRNITNTYKPSLVSVEGTKTWDDNDDQDGKRPESITVNLLADGKEVAEKTVTAEDDWKYSFTDLNEFKDELDVNGQPVAINYTVTEDTVEGYTTEINGYDITNTYAPGKTSVTVSKVWDDANNQDGKRPATISLQLTADGKASGEVVTLSEDNNWTYTWSDLDQKANKQDIVYAVEEAEVEGYKSKVSAIKDGQIVVTNTYNPETTAVEVSKTWDDAENQDGLRPDKVTVQLYADDEKSGSEVTLSAENGWAYTWSDLALKAKGKDIAYTVKEVSEVEGYTSDVSGDPVTGFTITNRHKVAETAVSGQKTWEDKNDQDGKRPESITVNLLADGQEVAEKTVTAEDDWKYSFEGLPKFKNGQEIVYTITEDAVANYAVTQDGYNLTNSYTPGKTSVTVSKVWDDENDQDGLRPDSIEVQLYANGEKSGDVVVLSKDNNWTYIWNELDLKADKKEIVYSVSEISDVKGYQKTVSSVENGQAVIINHHVPTKPEGPGQTPPTPPSSTEDKKSSDKAPKLVKDIKKAIGKVLPSTGENSSILGFIGVGILALLAYYIIKRRKA
ncbi:Cna B-type domain-containing protein [Streptococcus pluranimalium]|uniref:Cna B-type domain-containing protein n=1 Tax=Streptococcus pluranimalium TaxID=82348 RepID=UPI0024155C37|nr:Cna B-type domain-containing protein [Streptococcus pluranimalium]WFM79730.1 Cna B-type domain-containing protein [Streptococcus pluranimalium]